MKFYNSMGPNPRMVKIFMKEKGIEIPFEEVDLRGGENRRGAYLEINPAGQLPALELDNGMHLAEITAICEYLDEKYPEPALIGETAEERAETRMWTRRVDLNICEPMANGFRYGEGLGLFKDRIHVIPEASKDLKEIASEKLAWLDGLMNGHDYIAGDRYTMADILLFSFVEFAQNVGQPLDPGLKNIGAWFERVKSRPAVQAA